MTNPKADADITSQSTGSPTIDVVDRHITEWLKLQSSLREDNRFFPPSSEWAEKMISASVSRRSGLEVGTPVFRARINGGDRMRMPLQRHEVGRPVHQEDPLEYLTTQYLAQGLKRGRLDGVKFRSAVTPEGINLALFDTTAVGFKDVSL